MKFIFSKIPTTLLVFYLLFLQIQTSYAELPIIDAHSQADQNIRFEEIIHLMNKAQVSRTILAARDKRKNEDLIAFASHYPERITPALRTKGKAWNKKGPKKFKAFLKNQLRAYEFGAMAEILLWHEEKTKHKKGNNKPPPKIIVPPDDPKVKVALKITRKNKWPLIVHIEFASTGSQRESFMSKFESLLRENPTHPFILIHMGQLQPNEVERLISEHSNIYFITSHTTPITVNKTNIPLINMFNWLGTFLKSEWQDLLLKFPERFILGFDNVWVQNWQKHYVDQVALWRKTLKKFPDDIAHKIAHGNAERLWKLKPLKE